jgi:DNA adenine methylase
MNYPGGKNGAGVYQTIINQIPPHRVYVEAFCGSAAVWRHKRPADLSYLIDIDPDVTSTIGNSALPPGRQGGNADARSNLGEWADDSGPRGDRHAPAIQVICADASRWLSGLLKRLKERGRQPARDYFVYLDPPYMGSSRRSGPQRRVYRYEMMGDEAIGETDHRELLTVLLALPCPVALSGYDSPLYTEMLASWRRLDYQAMTRGGKMATESLWMNYVEPRELHDYRYLGRNFRERQDFKRMRARWLARLEAMPRVKRMALMAALSEAKLEDGSHDEIEQHPDEGRGPDPDEPIEGPESG